MPTASSLYSFVGHPDSVPKSEGNKNNDRFTLHVMLSPAAPWYPLYLRLTARGHDDGDGLCRPSFFCVCALLSSHCDRSYTVKCWISQPAPFGLADG